MGELAYRSLGTDTWLILLKRSVYLDKFFHNNPVLCIYTLASLTHLYVTSSHWQLMLGVREGLPEV